MRSYGQFCPLAKTLDVVGDRWSLLIVRELLTRGPCRYTDIRNGLPGIATNLLAERLKELERAGVIRREMAPPPIASTLFRLTTRGEELRGVIRAMAVWGVPFLREAGEDDVFRSHWLVSPASISLTDTTPERPPIAIEIRAGDEPITVETVDGEVRARPGPAEHPDSVITGPPRVVLELLVGRVDLRGAEAQGLEYEGDPAVLGRLQPRAIDANEPPAGRRGTRSRGTRTRPSLDT